jgi:hypothetical protein
VSNTAAAAQGFQVTAVICDTNSTGGPDCKTPIEIAATVPKLTLLMEEIHYFKSMHSLCYDVSVVSSSVLVFVLVLVLFGGFTNSNFVVF